DGKQVAQGRIAETIPVRFSLDETFDVGEDTGTPVIETYVDKMPFKFPGTLKKVVVVLEPEKLTAEERRRLQAEEARAGAAVREAESGRGGTSGAPAPAWRVASRMTRAVPASAVNVVRRPGPPGACGR